MEDEFYVDYAHCDEIQRGFIDRKVNKSMVVTGTAGSGKSLIALHKAKRVAAMGASYAIVVFTKTLKKYFSDGLRQLGLDFNKVFYWNEWKGCPTTTKFLIVDECQDFCAEDIDLLRSHAEICFFFGDSAQSIMSFKGPLQSVQETANKLGVVMEPLYKNYRLTIENAELAEKIANLDDVAEKCTRNGEKPRLIKKDSIDAQLDEIIRTIQNQHLSNVGILMPHNTIEKASSHSNNGKFSVEYVKDYFQKKGVPVEFKYNANMDTEMDLDFHSTNPKVMTWWCAKGLQFKDVFIPNCQMDYSSDKVSALYVAMTRTSERLYLLYSDRPSSIFPPSNSSLYAQTAELDLE